MGKITRREFVKRSAVSSTAAAAALSGVRNKKARAFEKTQNLGSFIDLTKCDGCKNFEVPLCVSACREENKDKFPDPPPSEGIPNYWPHEHKEDWTDKKELVDCLTPFNWTFVQKVSVDYKGQKHELYIPRRCMHCANPPCANICPFSAINITPEGVSVIDHGICFGGAKCRDVCPWEIPARQAGVGLYMNMIPDYMGGGLMYKCDFCSERIKKNQLPACEEACPKGAIKSGDKNEVYNLTVKRSQEIDGFIYGDKENGGTSTFYVSPVPFEKIHEELLKQKAQREEPEARGFPGMPPRARNIMDTPNGIALGFIIAPLAGILTAGALAYKTMKGADSNGKEG